MSANTMLWLCCLGMALTSLLVGSYHGLDTWLAAAVIVAAIDKVGK